MSFSFATSIAVRIIKHSRRQGVNRTHFVSAAVKRYSNMLACNAWTCEGDPSDAASYGGQYCGHINSSTAETCEACGEKSPDAQYTDYKRERDARLAERETGAPIEVAKA